MTKAQKRAVKNYRGRLAKRGLARFEVMGLSSDRGLIRSLARQLAANDAQATQIRDIVNRTITEPPARKGTIIEVFRNSPMVGADLDLKRLRP
jgi:hypothetical protein